MRFFNFVRQPWRQRAWLLPAIVVSYLCALLWVLLTSRQPRVVPRESR
jgi:hypothetical protein